VRHSAYIIDQLERHAGVFKTMLADVDPDERLFRYEKGKWNLLEIVCHLHDEECEDFRARVRHILEQRPGPMPSIDPAAWVMERNYGGRDYAQACAQFVDERARSVRWLRGLKNPQWDLEYVHTKFGKWTAGFMLANWLAHDYLHLRQITRTRYFYLGSLSGKPDYAGDW
jgi:hypothetical protein